MDFDPKVHLEMLVGGMKSVNHAEETSLSQLYPILTESARDQFHEVVDTNPELKAWFDYAQARFAGVGAKNQHAWTINEIQPAWRRLVKTWLLDEVIKDARDIVFVRLTSGQIMSEDEFELIEGSTVDKHLDDFIETTTCTVKEIKLILRAKLIDRSVPALNKNGEMKPSTSLVQTSSAWISGPILPVTS